MYFLYMEGPFKKIKTFTIRLMDYIAVIDYEHLDNGMFLSSFARAIAQQKESRGVIIHSDSAYTERLLQSGMFREDAIVRAIRDLNHRLIALLADYGVSAIGLNGHQRSLVSRTVDGVKLNVGQLTALPKTPHLLISSLTDVPGESRPGVLGLPNLAELLQKELNIPEVILFSMDDAEEMIRRDLPGKVQKEDLDTHFSSSNIPFEFREIPFSFRLSSTHSFAGYPSIKGTTSISP